MKSSWKLRLITLKTGRSLGRVAAKIIRNIVPFALRQRVLCLIGGPARAEIKISEFKFNPTSRWDIICFPVIDWSFLFQRPQHLVEQFAGDGHRVFYLHKSFHQSSYSSAFIRALSDNIYGLRFPGPAGTRVVYQSEIDGPLLQHFLETLDDLRHHAGIKKAICLVDLPFWAPLAFAARGQWGWKIVYDCMDDHRGFTTNSPVMTQHEEGLILGSDLVVATSQALYDRVSPSARRALLLHNATDFDHFSRSGSCSPLSGLPHPIIGYFGTVSEWFNLRMVEAAAVARPHWQFVFIGDAYGVDLSSLKHLSNVHFVGILPYHTLPACLQQFDVACIPYLLTPLTQAMNPVKFYEYLSMGKPVVAVDLPELKPYSEYFYLVRSTQDFITQIEAALVEQSVAKVQARVTFARQNTWSHRYEVLKDALEIDDR